MSVVNHDGTVGYVHLAKTGGTSIENVLVSLGWKHLPRPPFKKSHIVGHEVMKANIPTLQKSYSVVRNPVDRAISYYRHAVYRQLERAKENNCQKQLKRLETLQLGFLPWFWEHCHTYHRWKAVHQSMFETVYNNKITVKDHTDVYDYDDRNNFWKAIIGYVPKESKAIHNYNGLIEKPKLNLQERTEIIKIYELDFQTWGNQFNWQ